MKHFFTLACLTVTTIFAQQNQLSYYTAFDSPFKTVMPNMSTNFGLGLSYSHKPVQSFPMFIELKGSVGMYASQSLQQTYQFTNGSTTQTNVSYTSSLNKVLLGSKFIISNDYRPLRVYVTPQLGFAGMRSKIVIADPQDEDDCKPLEKRTVQRDMGFVYGGEIGMQFDLNRVFKHVEQENRSHFNLSFSFLTSPTKYSYINVKYMQSGSLDDAPDGTRDVNASFINVTSNTIHEHKIAELYHTKFQMWGINVGYIFTF